MNAIDVPSKSVVVVVVVVAVAVVVCCCLLLFVVGLAADLAGLADFFSFLPEEPFAILISTHRCRTLVPNLSFIPCLGTNKHLVPAPLNSHAATAMLSFQVDVHLATTPTLRNCAVNVCRAMLHPKRMKNVHRARAQRKQTCYFLVPCCWLWECSVFLCMILWMVPKT